MKVETTTGLLSRFSFTAVRSPKWLVPLNNLARLFGLMLTPIGKPIMLDKLLSEMTFKDEVKGVPNGSKEEQYNTERIARKAD